MRIYVAGPMSGKLEFNFPMFHAVADSLRQVGHDVVNPAELDIDQGFNPNTQQGFTRDDWHAAMRRDIEALLTVDGIALLPGWAKSEGACAEVTVGKALGLWIDRWEHSLTWPITASHMTGAFE